MEILISFCQGLQYSLLCYWLGIWFIIDHSCLLIRLTHVPRCCLGHRGDILILPHLIALHPSNFKRTQIKRGTFLIGGGFWACFRIASAHWIPKPRHCIILETITLNFLHTEYWSQWIVLILYYVLVWSPFSRCRYHSLIQFILFYPLTKWQTLPLYL